MEEAAMVFALIGVLGSIFGLVGVRGCMDRHPRNFIEQPYCEAAKIQEQEYKRCWKTEEVK